MTAPSHWGFPEGRVFILLPQPQTGHSLRLGLFLLVSSSPKPTSTSASLTMLVFVWITTNCGKFLKRWECQATLPASWETCMQVKKQQLESDMERWTGSKLGKEYVKAAYYHLASLSYMQSTSYEMLVESRLPGEISTTSDMQMTPPLWQKVKN